MTRLLDQTHATMLWRAIPQSRINKLRKNDENDSDLSFGAVTTVASK
jgi:hypothetical protein